MIRYFYEIQYLAFKYLISVSSYCFIVLLDTIPTLSLVTLGTTCIPRFYLQQNQTTKLTHGFGIYDLMNEHCVKIDITYIFLIHNNKSVWCAYTYFFTILFQLKISFWKNSFIIRAYFSLCFSFSFILHMVNVQSIFDYK